MDRQEAVTDSQPTSERRAPRNRLSRWAAMQAAAARFREGRITMEHAAKEAGVSLEDFRQFLVDSPART